MYLWKSEDGTPPLILPRVKPPYCDNDAQFWKDLLTPQVIPPLGIQDIKWRELYKKWRPYVMEDKWIQWRYYCELPPEAKLKVVEKQSKKARKQRTTRATSVMWTPTRIRRL
jgi:hypothetical protein